MMRLSWLAIALPATPTDVSHNAGDSPHVQDLLPACPFWAALCLNDPLPAGVSS